ncbi:MAG: hypothetical protein WAX67_06505 [Rugosibacter sp.]
MKLRIILLFALSALLAPARAEEAAAELAPAAVPEVTPETVPALPAPDSAHPAHPIEQPLAPAAEAAPSAPVESPAEQPAVAPPALNVLPGREGYAFGKPEILVRQRLFGLAHGVSLLAAACLDLPEQSLAIQQAYASWHAQHAQAIETIVHDLAGYYFGEQASAVQWLDLVRALKLKDNIGAALGEFELGAACATLPQAMAGPRYDLTALLRDDPLAAMATIAGVPVPDNTPEAAGKKPVNPVPVNQESPHTYAPFPHR